MRLHSTRLGVYVPGLGDFIDADRSAFLTDLSPAIGLGDFIDGDRSAFLTSLAPGLGDFVGGDRSAFLTDLSPAIGLGDFVGGDRSAFLTSLAPMLGLGDFAPAPTMYPVPMNSVLTSYGLAGLSDDHDDCGCGCAGSCGGGLSGISESLSSMGTWVSGQFDQLMAGNYATIALWGGGAVLALYLVFGARSGGYRDSRKALRAEYKKKAASLRSEYPTVYARGRRAAAAF